jgi:hypothetical protein
MHDVLKINTGQEPFVFDIKGLVADRAAAAASSDTISPAQAVDDDEAAAFAALERAFDASSNGQGLVFRLGTDF